MFWYPFHCISITASPSSASLPWLFSISVAIMANGVSLMYSKLITSDPMQTNKQTNNQTLHKHGRVSMSSCSSWFLLRLVRDEFQTTNSKSTNFSANAMITVLGLMTITVPNYMKNLFQRRVSRHFTWPSIFSIGTKTGWVRNIFWMNPKYLWDLLFL